ncbi:D-inositol-3-phosphate glycosyltransferase [Austwickia sp. TVS 96-490-7B]|uniref:glycosyltransferase family 4 protein n=1 Tax=Austwickia sp. TVS 96-490-7B TaxID=2830843 RepID=UPI001C583BAE|nr:glycosyltransferase family 4 protein [Austwickia sp. TVS 96-490-7B]MBW3084580.1 D-inositol-3-phosphate glycosyltransferase [Austwickia sp. TVS 96-490-7B]
MPAIRRIAYLNSQYPAISHTFIEREVTALRDQGWQIDTFSVRPCPPQQAISAAMRAELSSTAVLLADKAVLARAVAEMAAHHPDVLSWAAGQAARVGDRTVRAKIWQGFYLAEAVLLHQWMRERGLRHVHAHMANVSADVVRLATMMGERIDGPGSWSWSLTVHGYAEFQYVDQWDIPAKVRQARGVAAISDFTRSQLMRLVGPEQWDKIEVVRMAVDPDRFAPPPAARNHDGPVRLITVGRLVPLKGFPILVEAVSLLQSRGIAVQVRIIGDGEERADLQHRIDQAGLQGLVELVGPVGQDDLPAHYHWADVFVLPSFIEGLPVVLMEAMATELPAVASGITGIPELVVDQVNGLLVRPGRADQLADAIAQLAADQSLRTRMGQAGRRSILAEFTPRTTGPAMTAFLDRVIPG